MLTGGKMVGAVFIVLRRRDQPTSGLRAELCAARAVRGCAWRLKRSRLNSGEGAAEARGEGDAAECALCRRPLLPGRSQVFPGAFSAVRTFLELWEGSQPGNVCWERI